LVLAIVLAASDGTASVRLLHVEGGAPLGLIPLGRWTEPLSLSWRTVEVNAGPPPPQWPVRPMDRYSRRYWLCS